MSETTPQDFAAFLESLKVNNDGPEGMHGWRFDDPLSDFESKNMPSHPPLHFLVEMIDYLVERCRRVESNAKPSDLAEQVKAFMRAGMDAKPISDWMEFRRLSEPEI